MKGHKEALGGGRFIYSFVCSDDVTSSYAQAHQIIHIKYVQFFVDQLFINEVFFKSQHDKYIITERAIQSLLSISTHVNKQTKELRVP